MNTFKLLLHPSKFFLTVFAAVFIFTCIDSILHDGFPSISGILFICQSTALLTTTCAVLTKKQWRNQSVSWLAASLVTIVVSLFSFYVFHYGPRIVTEADGPARIGYSCELGETDKAVIDRTGEYYGDFTANNLTANLCWFRNIPLGASNTLPALTDYNSDGGITFLLFETVILLSFIGTKRWRYSSHN